FNATNFFSRQPDRLKRNQAGFTLGGPVRKNRLFAFGGYQRLWIRSAPGNLPPQTFTAAQRPGGFFTNPITNRRPVTNQPFPDNRIPASQFSAAAQKLLALSPLPGADGFAPYSTIQLEDGRQYIGRLDYVASARHTVMLRAFRNEQENPLHSAPDN